MPLLSFELSCSLLYETFFNFWSGLVWSDLGTQALLFLLLVALPLFDNSLFFFFLRFVLPINF